MIDRHFLIHYHYYSPLIWPSTASRPPGMESKLPDLPPHLLAFHSACLSAFSTASSPASTLLRLFDTPTHNPPGITPPPSPSTPLLSLLTSIGLDPNTGKCLHPTDWHLYPRVRDAARREWHAEREERASEDLRKLLDGLAVPMIPSREDTAAELRQFKTFYGASVGTHPFLAGLMETLSAQLAHPRMEIEWEFDDAVFTESAAPDSKFASAAVRLLRDILSFDHHISTTNSDTDLEAGINSKQTNSQLRVWVLSRPISTRDAAVLCRAALVKTRLSPTGRVRVTSRARPVVAETWWDWVWARVEVARLWFSRVFV
ncbi:hypothetical protein DFJ77DRAFT_479531 [Powellomyces hirtus]|nr:hypothetical protein DFJ77DRAFT_479531 [Powellomyces hirtus]